MTTEFYLTYLANCGHMLVYKVNHFCVRMYIVKRKFSWTIISTYCILYLFSLNWHYLWLWL